MAHRGRRNADHLVIVKLAGGATVRATAAATGVSERTIFRRLQDPAFRQQIYDTRASMVAETTGLLARSSTAAVNTLVRLLRSPSDTVRLGAARSLLEFELKYREGDELERRIHELEARIM